MREQELSSTSRGQIAAALERHALQIAARHGIIDDEDNGLYV
jgi:hypothetical protein